MSGINPFLIHAQSLAKLQGTMGDQCPVVTILGRDVRAMPGSSVLRKDLSIGGFMTNADLMFTLLVSSFGADADAVDIKNRTLQRECTYLGELYKVDNVTIHAGGLQLHFEANSMNQNA